MDNETKDALYYGAKYFELLSKYNELVSKYNELQTEYRNDKKFQDSRLHQIGKAYDLYFKEGVKPEKKLKNMAKALGFYESKEKYTKWRIAQEYIEIIAESYHDNPIFITIDERELPEIIKREIADFKKNTPVFSNEKIPPSLKREAIKFLQEKYEINGYDACRKQIRTGIKQLKESGETLDVQGKGRSLDGLLNNSIDKD